MSDLNRRDFLKVVGVTGAASAVGCDPTVPIENVLPYVVQPSQLVPGIATWISTQCNECSSGCGILAKNREGRVVNVQGNPDSPISKGSLCAVGQAGIQGTYSPDRFAYPMVAGSRAEWNTLLPELAGKLSNGKVAWIGYPRTGASGALVEAFMSAHGYERPLYWDPNGDDALRAATGAVFGSEYEGRVPSYDLTHAHTVLSFGADFMSTWGSVSVERGWADSRDPAMGGFVGKTVTVSPRIGVSESITDLHLAARTGSETALAMAMAAEVCRYQDERVVKGHDGNPVMEDGQAVTETVRGPSFDSVSFGSELNAVVDEAFVAAAVKSADIEMGSFLKAVKWLATDYFDGHRTVVLPGGEATSYNATELAKATLMLNEVLGNIGPEGTVSFGREPNHSNVGSYQDVVELMQACQDGAYDVLFIDGIDLAHVLPRKVNVMEALQKVGTIVALANEPNETVTLDTIGNGYVLPIGTTLETWGDGEATKGVHTLQQPAMKPLLSTKSFGEVLLVLADKAGTDLAQHRPWLAQAYKDAKECREQQAQRVSNNEASSKRLDTLNTEIDALKVQRDEKLANPLVAPVAGDAGSAEAGTEGSADIATQQAEYEQALAGLKEQIEAKETERDQIVQSLSEQGECDSDDPTAMAAIAGDDVINPFHSFIRRYWQDVVYSGADELFDAFWVDCLQRGGYWAEVNGETPAQVGAEWKLDGLPTPGDAAPDGQVLVLFPHPFLMDGRHANKPWSQEVPEPMSSHSWGTWIEVHPDVAAEKGFEEGKTVMVKALRETIEVAWFGSPGIRKDTIALVMGNGHTQGRYAKIGGAKNPILMIEGTHDQGGALQYVSTASVDVTAEGNDTTVSAYIGNIDTDGRPVNFTVSVEDVEHSAHLRHQGKGDEIAPGSIVPMHHFPVDERLKKHFGKNAVGEQIIDMFPEPEHPTHRFAMAIDLNRCNGCNACSTACFAESNIPVVGPDQMKRARFMGWVRLSRYWEGEGDTPDIRFQPVMCMQCSHAPCENVCPVLATYHNLDGLNAMVYNRCVGTRYCANNCPYTARRFNFHSYKWPESFNLMLNPDVVTREMGVMEKCTFCVQRIREEKDRRRDEVYAEGGLESRENNLPNTRIPEERLLRLPACAAACPTDAMTFGNLKVKGTGPEAEKYVFRKFQDERAFAMLGELNTKPAVRYLARITHEPSKLHGGH